MLNVSKKYILAVLLILSGITPRNINAIRFVPLVVGGIAAIPAYLFTSLGIIGLTRYTLLSIVLRTI